MSDLQSELAAVETLVQDSRTNIYAQLSSMVIVLYVWSFHPALKPDQGVIDTIFSSLSMMNSNMSGGSLLALVRFYMYVPHKFPGRVC